MFAAFNGEAWGYLGSRKFLQELDEGADSVNGISSLMIEQVSPRLDWIALAIASSNYDTCFHTSEFSLGHPFTLHAWTFCMFLFKGDMNLHLSSLLYDFGF